MATEVKEKVMRSACRVAAAVIPIARGSELGAQPPRALTV